MHFRRGISVLSMAALTSAAFTGGCATHYVPNADGLVKVVMEGGQPQYERGDEVYPMGSFGSGLEDAVHGNPRAEEAARTFHHHMLAGFLSEIGGLVCFAGATGIAAGTRDQQTQQTAALTGLGCLLVGSAVGLGLMMSGAPYQYDAINIYNDGVKDAQGRLAVPNPSSVAPTPNAPKPPAPSADEPTVPAQAPETPTSPAPSPSADEPGMDL
jgi:hypothetical protein